jgi:ATP-dependent RNA helicase UAP56/SUB2
MAVSSSPFKSLLPFISKKCVGVPISQNRETLKSNPPHIVVGTPGRVLGLLREKSLKLDKIKHFVMDECDKMLEAVGK